MDSQHILGSLNRINTALAVSWSNTIIANTSQAMHDTEPLSIALLVGIMVLSMRPQSRVEREMKNTTWHLWMTIVTNAMLNMVRQSTSSFLEQLTRSAIILMLVEQFHTVTKVLSESSLNFLHSTKYLFAESLSVAFSAIAFANPLLSSTLLLLMYQTSQVFSQSPTVRNSVALMVFDAMGDILLSKTGFAVNKITIAVVLSLLAPQSSPFSEHLREYSRWEAAQEVLALSAGREYHAILLCFMALLLVNHVQTSRLLREAVHDITAIAFFDLFFKEITAVAQKVFLNDAVIPFILSLFALALTRTKIMSLCTNNKR